MILVYRLYNLLNFYANTIFELLGSFDDNLLSTCIQELADRAKNYFDTLFNSMISRLDQDVTISSPPSPPPIQNKTSISTSRYPVNMITPSIDLSPSNAVLDVISRIEQLISVYDVSMVSMFVHNFI